MGREQKVVFIMGFLHPDFNAIPDELRRIDRWVVWKAIPDPDGGKPRKVPCDRHGKAANAHSAGTWMTFAEARALYERGEFTGVGIVLTGQTEACGRILAGVDFDGVTPADVADELQALGGYAEVSPSGNGVRVFAWTSQPFATATIKDGDRGTEVYCAGRYLTVTGRRIVTEGGAR